MSHGTGQPTRCWCRILFCFCAAIDGFKKDARQKGAINWMNLGGWALARFDSVAKLKEELQNNMQVRTGLH